MEQLITNATSLHHCLQNHRQYFTILCKLNSGVGHKEACLKGFITPFYTAIVGLSRLFQLHFYTAIVELFQAFPASWGDNQSYASISHTILNCAYY